MYERPSVKPDHNGQLVCPHLGRVNVEVEAVFRFGVAGKFAALGTEGFDRFCFKKIPRQWLGRQKAQFANRGLSVRHAQILVDSVFSVVY